ncbi:MAG: sugar ABC transporter permease [Chloroflexota bacterium]|nr:MAG: sugar ABC transporter permease [Chloroflexota bacterium]
MKTFAEVSIERTLIPHQIVWKNYTDLFTQTNILTHLVNTFWISALTTILTLLLSTMTGYTITRYDSVGGEFVARFTLFTYMAPSIVLLLPLYLVLKAIGLINTHAGLISSYLTFTLPFAIWMMRAYFQTIPQSMEEAAVVDGANRFQAFFWVVIPQAIPGLISTATFIFIMCWSEFLYPLVLISTDDLKTITVTLAALTGGGQNIKFSLLMAASTVATLPIILIFLFLQKYLVRGFAAGGYE